MWIADNNNTYRYLTPNGDAIIDKYQKSSYVKTLKMKLRFAENNFSYWKTQEPKTGKKDNFWYLETWKMD